MNSPDGNFDNGAVWNTIVYNDNDINNDNDNDKNDANDIDNDNDFMKHKDCL